MSGVFRILILGLLLWIMPAQGSLAQESMPVAALPPVHQLDGFNFEYQGWNNCGPATLTNALSFFGYADDQLRAAQWLKPNNEDKNVSPDEMVAFVNNEVPEVAAYAMHRYGTGLDDLKRLLANGFPVIIEAGYDPPPYDLGWMGHYLLVYGYDDTRREFLTHDSYDGPNLAYSYDHVNEFWRHFNRLYIVLYESGREADLLDLLGDNADAMTNAQNALAVAREEATADPEDAFAWFNMGTSYVALAPVYGQEAYEYAAVAFDQAREKGLPWRMMWYQFGPFEAYNAIGRYDDTLALAANNLNDGGGHWVEETFYYAGYAREQMGETQRALDNYQQAVYLNANFTAARDARDRLRAASG